MEEKMEDQGVKDTPQKESIWNSYKEITSNEINGLEKIGLTSISNLINCDERIVIECLNSYKFRPITKHLVVLRIREEKKNVEKRISKIRSLPKNAPKYTGDVFIFMEKLESFLRTNKEYEDSWSDIVKEKLSGDFSSNLSKIDFDGTFERKKLEIIKNLDPSFSPKGAFYFLILLNIKKEDNLLMFNKRI